MNLAIDLNCDLGEGSGADVELMPLVTSANIACGGHAGDEATLRAAVALARRHGVAIGAHPGLEDRGSFGRAGAAPAPEEARALVVRQVRRLQAVAAESGARVVHVKPHGALYNRASRDRALADAVARAVREADPRLALVGLAGGELLAAGRAAGLAVAAEAFADRTYQADGSLTPRSRPDALVADAASAAARALRIAREGRVRAVDGTDVAVAADTICLHGDGPGAVAFARAIRAALAAGGVAVRAVPFP